MMAALLAGVAPVAQPAAAQALDTDRIARERFGNDAPWYRDRIPYFESADARIDDVYYYRWKVYRAHQRDLGGRGYITTEFMDDVGWQLEPWASLNDATGFHLAEGRWLRDRRFADDYIRFMYTGGNDRHFTDHMADSVWARYLVDGDVDGVTLHLGAMRRLFADWDDHLDRSKGLYWVEPLLDATEYTVSSIDASGGQDGFRGGDSFRPSINAYMVANARAIGRIARLRGEHGLAAEFTERADTLQTRLVDALWNADKTHFLDRYKVSNEHVRYWDPIRARELVGYLPWMFDAVPDDPRYAAAWGHLLSADGFAGEYGMRTVEPGYQYYMRQYRYLGDQPECQWNGPVWPYQTTQVLTGMANLLDHYRDTGGVTRSHYMRLLRQYAALHFQGDRLDLEEDYHPDQPGPIVGLDRSHHYFHSGFNDLILTGLVGVRPRADDVLEINPLVPAAATDGHLPWFRVEKLPYHGRDVTISWDADGSRYGRGPGLAIAVDGREVARRPTLGRLTVPLARRAVPTPDRPINLAVAVDKRGWPRATASSNTDAEAMHDAIDGRTWFFPELRNGWTSDAASPRQWFELDLGRQRTLTRAEIAFFAGDRIAPPRGYHLEVRDGDAWRRIDARLDTPLANGITHAEWRPTTARHVRLVLDQQPGRPVRLVELKLF